MYIILNNIKYYRKNRVIKSIQVDILKLDLLKHLYYIALI